MSKRANISESDDNVDLSEKALCVSASHGQDAWVM